jgi:hypothetical protein
VVEGATFTRTLRDPTVAERLLIAALLHHLPEDRRRFSAQLQLVKVVGGCRCGCPSVDLSLVGRVEDLTGSEILVGGDASSPEGTPVAVMLWIRNRELVSLEVHAWDDTRQFGLPKPETLKNITLGVD